MDDFFDITRYGSTTYKAGKAGKKFGVVDPGRNLMAFSEPLKNDMNRYGAVVEYVDTISFSPIDHNDSYEATCAEGERKCDFFLHTESRRTLIFVELKDRYTSNFLDSVELKSLLDANPSISREGVAADVWIDDVIEQLTDTIQKFRKLNASDLDQYPTIHLAYGANKKVEYGVDFPVVNKKDDFYIKTRFQLILSNLIKVPQESPPVAPIELSIEELRSMTM